jgi:hypothetical protein
MNLTAQIAPPATGPAGPRPYFVRGLLGCLTATAGIGIVALLTGSFDETGARVLGSTWLVGLFCMLCLADLTVLDTPRRAVGTGGIAAAAAALGLGLTFIWSLRDDWNDGLEVEARAFLVTGVLAVALAHASLLLRINLRSQDSLAAVRAATLTVLSIVATMCAAPAVSYDVADSEGYWRLLGVLAILDVLGTVSLPVLARFETRTAR